MENEIKVAVKEKEILKANNKQIKFQLNNYKYKVLDLEKKLLDSQFKLVVEKRNKSSFLI